MIDSEPLMEESMCPDCEYRVRPEGIRYELVTKCRYHAVMDRIADLERVLHHHTDCNESKDLKAKVSSLEIRLDEASTLVDDCIQYMESHASNTSEEETALCARYGLFLRHKREAKS